jgi:hypothetical protein
MHSTVLREYIAKTGVPAIAIPYLYDYLSDELLVISSAGNTTLGRES